LIGGGPDGREDSLMHLKLRPDVRIQKVFIGNEKAPLLVIDNFVREPEQLIRPVASKAFIRTARFFPGVRAKAPLTYRQLVLDELQDELLQFFRLNGNSMRFSMCHYSLVTTPPQELAMVQRVPHVDSVDEGLASIHYLFRKGYGGTAFYRHRRTGFEYIDKSRQDLYLKMLDEEVRGPGSPEPAYINSDTPLFEQVEKQDGVFNRILFYRRNSLHSGSIERDFVPDTNPLTGRLSINCFIDVGPFIGMGA
jgi:hypothetical protein